MRLLRLASETSLISADIRAALISLGRGDSVVGGLALLGAQPAFCEHPIEAIVLPPRHIMIIVGVDLDNPVLTLRAPLMQPWIADGWPISMSAPDPAATSSVTAENEAPSQALVEGRQPREPINPGSAALDMAQLTKDRILEALSAKFSSTQESSTMDTEASVSIVIAVGPFVETVEQPESELAQATVLFPTPATILTQISHESQIPHDSEADHPLSRKPFSLEQIHTVLALLSPEIEDLADAQLIAEGFSESAEVSHRGISGGAVWSPEPQNKTEEPPLMRGPASVAAERSRRRRKRVRTILVVGATVVVIAFALTTTAILIKKDKDVSSAATIPSPVPTTSAPSPVQAEWELLDYARDQRCASHGFGEVQASLQRTSCDQIGRISFKATVHERVAAVTISVVSFPNRNTAIAFEELAKSPTSGGIVDLAAEIGKWPERSIFENSARASALNGNQVRLVRATWSDHPSTAGDPILIQLAQKGLTTELPI